MTAPKNCVGVIGGGENTRKKHLPGLLGQPGVEIRKGTSKNLNGMGVWGKGHAPL